MSLTELTGMLEGAVESLFVKLPSILDFTPETRQTEWNLAYHLANEIHPLLNGLDCDLDVIKPGYGDRRPDIIFHKRGTHKSNYLVVELKRDGTAQEIESDIRKIHEHWFTGKLQYRFGAVIDLRTNGNHHIQVFVNPANP